MARNEVFKDADYISLPAPTSALAGSPIRVGGLNGVLQTNEGSVDKPTGSYNIAPSSNQPGWASVALKGAFRLPVSTTGTLAIGDPVYIITAAGATKGDLTPAAGAEGVNPLFGHALSVKGATAGQPVIVRIAN